MNKHADNYMRRTEKLWQIAKQDEIYCIWELEHEDRKRRFTRIERFLPKKLAELFREYMDYDARRLNRVISLACMCMEFTGERPFEFKKRRVRNVIEFVPDREE